MSDVRPSRRSAAITLLALLLALASSGGPLVSAQVSAGDLALAAARLYACLHEAAASPLPRIAVAPIPADGIGAAINDRLKRAAA